VVWPADDSRLERQVAVKLLSLPPGTTGAERERLLAMFGREARAAAAPESSYIVPVFDHGTDGEVPYLVMPLISGRTVRELLDGETPPPERVAEIAAQVCRALATAHRAPGRHRAPRHQTVEPDPHGRGHGEGPRLRPSAPPG
jgi:serine/threonine protein kinase